MGRSLIVAVLLLTTALIGARYAVAGQAPSAASDPDIPISHQDRVYSAEQYSNTVSVTDPVDNKLLGTIRLGDPLPANLSPLYKGQLLVHGMGFSPDHRTIAVVAIGSNAVNFIDTATNSVKHITYVGRSPHEAFYTMDGSEVWVVVRGENYVSVLDGTTYEEKTRITVPNGPGMTIFSPDANTAMSAPPLHQRPKSSPLPITKSSAGLRKLALSVPTSPQRRTASRSGLP